MENCDKVVYAIAGISLIAPNIPIPEDLIVKTLNDPSIKGIYVKLSHKEYANSNGYEIDYFNREQIDWLMRDGKFVKDDKGERVDAFEATIQDFTRTIGETGLKSSTNEGGQWLDRRPSPQELERILKLPYVKQVGIVVRDEMDNLPPR